MVPRRVCNLQYCLLIVLFTTAVSSLDVNPDDPDSIERDTYRYSKYYDDRTDSSDDTTYEVAAPMKMNGVLNHPTKTQNGSHPDTNKNGVSTNENSDDTMKIDEVSIEDHKVETKKNDNNNDKDNTKHKIRLPDEYNEVKRLATLPGLKLSQADMTKFKIWPEAKIPFFIDDFSYDEFLRDKIRGYLEQSKALTGLNFVQLVQPPQDENERWVFFVNRRGQLDCKDYSTKSFTNTGVQRVIVGYDCLQNIGPMAAIVLALAGVPPQHNSPDRDRFIHVSVKSILPEKRGLFKRLKDGEWLFHDLVYDYYSIGHYASHKYTADGSATITAFSKGGRGQTSSGVFSSNHSKPRVFYMKHDEKDTYSSIDIQKIRLLYNNILQNIPKMNFDICKKMYRPRNPQLKISKPMRVKSIIQNQGEKLAENKTTDNNKLYAILSSLENINELYAPGYAQ